MTNIIPPYLFLITWVLLGPSVPMALTIFTVTAGLLIYLVMRRSFRARTLVLLGMLVEMFIQSLVPVFASIHIDLMKTRPPPNPVGGFSAIFPTVFAMSLGVALIGISAAVCAALFIEFGRSRTDMSKAFPTLKFLDAPAWVRASVNNLAGVAGINPPEALLVDSGRPSAFTVRAKRKYFVAVSVGLLESLDVREVEACIAHEISHLKNNDFRLRFAATLAKVALFTRPVSYLIEPAVYRAREFLADATAAKLIGGPEALISALSKLREPTSLITPTFLETACTCDLNRSEGVFRVFRKHPDLETRIRLLQEMSAI